MDPMLSTTRRTLRVVAAVSCLLIALSGQAEAYGNHNLAKAVNQLQSTTNHANIRPSDLSQKSVIRSNPFMSTTRRDPIRMPSQTPMVPYKPPNSEVAQLIDINAAMYRDRTVMLNKFIDEETANEFIAIMLYLRKEDPRAPISLYFNVPGGLLRPSLAIYDLIQNTKQNCRIETVNLALCAGMGAILCSAGTKGERSAMPNSRFLLQRTGMNEVFRGQATDIALEVKNVKKWDRRMQEELALLTGQDVEKISKDMLRDFYLSSDEAVRYGLIDRVFLPSPRKRAAGREEANLGAFEGDDDQKYQGGENQGGWGNRPPPTPPANGGAGGPPGGGDDDGPKIAKG
uniref:ATP-dependent Clp protease proteolytic subunit n=1 Tax=Entomoneis paludosa TaxID=265537 RepID=A0A7S3DMH9_9STRA